MFCDAHTPSGFWVSVKHATLSDSALSQPRTVHRAQLLPCRCSHYSSSPGPYAARRSPRRSWCTPFLHVWAGIRRESPLPTQFTWLSSPWLPSAPWSRSDLQIQRFSPPRDEQSVSRQRDPKGNERKCTLQRRRRVPLYSSSELLVEISQSAEGIQWVSEVEQRLRDVCVEVEGGEGCCVSSAAASTDAEHRRIGLVHLSHLFSHLWICQTSLFSLIFISHCHKWICFNCNTPPSPSPKLDSFFYLVTWVIWK